MNIKDIIKEKLHVSDEDLDKLSPDTIAIVSYIITNAILGLTKKETIRAAQIIIKNAKDIK